jgi:predicted permease
MRTAREWIQRLTGTLRPSRRDDDLAEELRLHAAMAAEDGRRVTGGTQAMDALRDQRGLPWLDDFARDVRHALRMVRRSPVVAAVVIATLAIGIAVNALVFTIVNAAVLRPLPFEDPDQIVRLSVTTGNARNPTADLSYLDLQDWQQARRTFEHIAAADDRMVDLSGDQQPPDRVEASLMSWNLLPLLRVPPALGRGFIPADELPGAPLVAIVSADLWRARYGADPDVLGRSIRIDGAPATIVGVMPPGFGFPNRGQLLVPAGRALPAAQLTTRDARTLNVVGRLRPGITIDQAQAELAGITTALADRHPDTNRNVAPRIEPARIAAELVAVVTVLLAAVGFVLLIACANVANVLLARAADRSREVTLRLAIGAGRWRVMRQLLAESLVLVLAGGAAGFALSYAGLQMFLANLPPEAAPPSWIQFTPDGVVFAYVAAICLGSTLVCGLVPAWQVSRQDLVAALNDTGRTTSGNRSQRRWTGAFVVAQVALALVLITGAALMVRNLAGLLRIDAGVDTDGLLQTGFILQRSEYTPERRLLFFDALEERLSSASGIDAALVSNPPMAGGLARSVRLDAQPVADSRERPVVSLLQVGRRYFDVLGAPLLAGRVLADGSARQPVDSVVVNERFAQMYFQTRSAIGARIRLGQPGSTDNSEGVWMTIVGVIGNVRQQMLPSGEFDPVVYAAYHASVAEPPRTMQVIGRSALGAGIVTSVVRDHVQALDPDLPLFPVSTIGQALARYFWPQRVFGSMLTVFAGIAVLLAAGGLYGVASYAVARRTREIGVRMALGADARRVWWSVSGATLRQLVVGLVLGTAGSAAVATLLPSMLVGTSGADPLMFAAMAVLLVLVGLAASAVPVRRAMRLDPLAVLRAE